MFYKQNIFSLFIDIRVNVSEKQDGTPYFATFTESQTPAGISISFLANV